MTALPRPERPPAITAPPERSPASLIGGVIIAPAFFVLALLVMREALGAMPGRAAIGVALILAAALGICVRLADL